MFHLLPFTVGLLAGAAAVKMVKNDQAKNQLDKAQNTLLRATVSSLSAIEQSSARLRAKLATESVKPVQSAIGDVSPMTKLARKRAPSRKTAAKVSAKDGAVG